MLTFSVEPKYKIKLRLQVVWKMEHADAYDFILCSLCGVYEKNVKRHTEMSLNQLMLFYTMNYFNS